MDFSAKSSDSLPDIGGHRPISGEIGGFFCASVGDRNKITRSYILPMSHRFICIAH